MGSKEEGVYRGGEKGRDDWFCSDNAENTLKSGNATLSASEDNTGYKVDEGVLASVDPKHTQEVLKEMESDRARAPMEAVKVNVGPLQQATKELEKTPKQ
jgi:hypothetical protein